MRFFTSGAKLTERALVLRHIEQRIVAEATCAVVFVQQLARAFAPYRDGLAVREHARDRAHKAARAVLFVFHVLQQERIAVRIRSLAVAGRADARRAAERVHAQTAVVRDDRAGR